MTNIYDFKKALEQKQLETKVNHFPYDIDYDKKAKDIAGKMAQMYKELAEDYKNLVYKYKFSTEFCQELATDLKKMGNDVLERQSDYMGESRQVDLLVHFINQRGLEDEYIHFLNDVKVNEENPDYRQAAIDQLESHIDGILWDEYGMIKEENLSEGAIQ